MEQNLAASESLQLKKLELEIHHLKKPSYRKPSFWIGIFSVLIVLLSGIVTEYIHDRIATFNLKLNHFKLISIALSNYVAVSELYVHLVKESEKINDPTDLIKIESQYDDAFLKVRKDQLFNYVLLADFWDKKTANEYADVMQSILDFDAIIHDLDSLYGKIRKGKEKLTSAELQQVKMVVAREENSLQALEVKLRAFLLLFASVGLDNKGEVK